MQPEKSRVRIFKTKSSADTKVIEKGERAGPPDTAAGIPLKPLVRQL